MTVWSLGEGGGWAPDTWSDQVDHSATDPKRFSTGYRQKG